MKKQIFLLSVGLLLAAPVLTTTLNAGSCCTNSCNTNNNCNNNCVPDHGKTRRDLRPPFQNASPELTSSFNSDALSNLIKEDKHGIFEVAVFGGKSTKCVGAAQYFLPYGNTSLTFSGEIANPVSFARVPAESVVQANAAVAKGDQLAFDAFYVGGAATSPSLLYADPATYQYDSNTDNSIIRPWNFGITFAALFEPLAVSASGAKAGTGLITNPAFNSTINPIYKFSHVGAGLALRYHFSDDKQGWFGQISTAVENVRSTICLNETVNAEAQVLNNTNFPESNPSLSATATLANLYGIYGGLTEVLTVDAQTNELNVVVVDPTIASTVAPVGSIYEAYLANPQFPGTSNATTTAATIAPANVTEAFNQDAWNYGKIGCPQKITRLADIELLLGYQWHCGDCAATNWYLGVVIPTGNKPKACYVAPAVVGNGQHAGIMFGSQTDLMLCDEEDYQAWYRLDLNARYLFRNTQKCSFDLMGNEWSRYMMVWASEEDYTNAVTAANTLTAIAVAGNPLDTYVSGVAQHNYTPGINVFTSDFYVKPGFQARINSAVNFQGEHFRGELGWNTWMREKDCIQMACEWKNTPAFADASYVGGLGLNRERTIFNDAQTSCYNAVDSLLRNTATPSDALITLAGNALSATNYDDFAITANDINYDSMATPAAITNTVYLSLGYAFESDYKPVLSVGGSYEFTSSNHALNQWMVWGKFEIGF